MASREEFFAWFKDLSGAKRIDAMCGLLSMCFPLELRYFGTCLEDLGKKDYHHLWEAEHRANDISYISKLTDVRETVVRSKLIVSVALLSSRNRECSNAIFKNVTETIKMENLPFLYTWADEKILSELLLLFSMITHHPAFTFEQRAVLTHHLNTLEQLKMTSETHDKTSTQAAQSISRESAPQLLLTSTTSLPSSNLQPGVPSDNTNNTSFQGQNVTKINSSERPTITGLDLKGASKKRAYRIQVSWSNGKQAEVHKTYKEISNFHRRVLNLFTEETHANNTDKYIPSLPSFTVGNTSRGEMAKDQTAQMAEYLKNLVLHLPHSILNHDLVYSFFQPPSGGRPPPVLVGRNSVVPNNLSVNTSVNSLPWQLLNLCNSQIPDNSTRTVNEGHSFTRGNQNILYNGKQNGNANSVSYRWPTNAASSRTSSMSSKSSSPQVSPPESCSNSRSGSPWIQTPISGDILSMETLKILGLDKHADLLRQYRIQELQLYVIDDLKRIGITGNDAMKLLKYLDAYSISKVDIMKTGRGSQTSSENCSSSDSCSPPQSPPPSELCQTSLSSGSEEGYSTRVPSAGSGHHKVQRSACVSSTSSSNDEGTDVTKAKSFGRKQSSKEWSRLPTPHTCTTTQSVNYVIPSRNTVIGVGNGCAITNNPHIITPFPHHGSSRVMPSNVFHNPVTSSSNPALPASQIVSSTVSQAVTTTASIMGQGQRESLCAEVKPQIHVQANSINNLKNSTYYIPPTSTSACVNTTNSMSAPISSPSLPMQYGYLGFLPHMFPQPMVHPGNNGFPPLSPSFLFPLLHSMPAGLLPDLLLTNQIHPPPSCHPQPSVPTSNNSTPVRTLACFNCGSSGHRGHECRTSTVDDLNSTGTFRLNYAPPSRVVETHN